MTKEDPTPFELASEFASVRVSLDHSGRGPRLMVEDLETDAVVYLDAVELASICHANADQRAEWLRTGPYAPPDSAPPHDDAPDR